jgi:hypothetical protein
VLVTLSDRHYGVSLNGDSVDHYNPVVLDANDYYLFGSLQPGRTYDAASTYRYGLNGQERDDEVAGPGNIYGAQYWEYDSRTGRRWNLDPKPALGVSEYAAFVNSPLSISDPFGDTVKTFSTAEVTHTTLNEKGGTSDLAGKTIDIKDVRLVPAADQNGNIIGYNVWDTKNKDLQTPILQLDAGDIEDFKQNYSAYVGGARAV